MQHLVLTIFHYVSYHHLINREMLFFSDSSRNTNGKIRGIFNINLVHNTSSILFSFRNIFMHLPMIMG
jgi:hypothetical protein